MKAKKPTKEWNPTLRTLLDSRPRVGMKFGHVMPDGASYLVCIGERGETTETWNTQFVQADKYSWTPLSDRVQKVEVESTSILAMVASARHHNRVLSEGFGYEMSHA